MQRKSRGRIYRMLAIAMTIGMLSSALVAGSVGAQRTASEPVSDNGITPYIIDGANPGGNRTCAEVGTAFFGDAEYYKFSSVKADFQNGNFINGSFPAGLTVIVTDGKYVSFSGKSIGAVIVKGSNDANVYVYDPQQSSDSGLAAPLTSSGEPAGLSNLTFCWNPVPEVPDGYWCSPGFWRANAVNWGASAWPVPTSTLYNSVITSPTASGNPTLLQVLLNPRDYFPRNQQGEGFNAVGDYLSAQAGLDGTFASNNGICPIDQHGNRTD